VAGALSEAAKMPPDRIVLVNLSGRGDKDLDTVSACLAGKEEA
jgi:tryptophan synthase beta subunit